MPSDITTRRALEVCMSRLPMWPGLRDWFARNLASAIENGEREVRDIDFRRATLARALSELETTNEDFSKRLLLRRIREAAHILRGVLDE